MLGLRSLLLILCLANFCGMDGRAETVREPSGRLAERLAGFLSREVRELEVRRQILARELEGLPKPEATNTSTRLGWLTPRLAAENEEVWVQVDLGQSYLIDGIVLVPASGESEFQSRPGNGFPKRFRIEIAEAATFAGPERVGDFTGADVLNPRTFPFVVNVKGKRGRFVRLTVTKAMSQQGQDWLVALGELMVLSGRRNVAAGREVSASASSKQPNKWATANLTDGQSVLGAPVGIELSPSNGYLALHEQVADVTKWVQVDLGREFALEEVCLFPARPTYFADSPGMGFPKRFRIEVSSEAAFTGSRRPIFESGEEVYINPGDNPVSFPANGEVARYVRVTATQLQDRNFVFSFGFAEIQIWSAGRNVATGAKVSALDRTGDNRDKPRWRPDFLVDGFNSRNRILDVPEWIRRLDRRHVIEEELLGLEERRGAATDAALRTLGRIGVGTLGGVMVLAGILVWRVRVGKRHEVEAVRRRIASDLHDEIGSNLGSIALLAEAARREGPSAEAAADFASIERVAARTHESLREIVWFVSAGAMTRGELVARMRESVDSFLGGMKCQFEAPPVFSDAECSLEFARNVWMVFKEALYNAARHSGASQVSIRVAEPAGGFELEVRDNGRGFLESEVEPGNGLLNLRRRATELKGSLHITSKAGHGTTLHLSIPRA